MTEQQHRLYRNQTNKVIAGVCGGLAEYLSIDATIVRLVWILLTFLGGSGIILYIIAFFIVPEKPVVIGDAVSPVKSESGSAKIFGILFVIAGIVLLLDNLDVFSFCRIWDSAWEFVLPGMLILAGFYLLTKHHAMLSTKSEQGLQTEESPSAENQNSSPNSSKEQTSKSKIFRRSLTDKKLLGICGGAGEYFGIDSTILRVVYAIFTIFSAGTGVILYFLLYLIVPEGQPQQNKQE
jgi:phage shock protein C